MKDQEAVILYHQAISVTANAPTDFGADMWSEALRDLRYEDARLALINLVKRSPFAGPSEIREEVHRIRAKRLALHGDPIPPYFENVADEIAWMREARRRIGDGEHVADSDRGELKAQPTIGILTKGMA
jgi:hypothetical protein